LPSLIARIRSNAPSCVLSLRTASVPRAIYLKVLSYPSPPRREMRSPEVIREASRRIQRREWSIHACESSGSLLDDARGTFDARHARSVVGAGAECLCVFFSRAEYSHHLMSEFVDRRASRAKSLTAGERRAMAVMVRETRALFVNVFGLKLKLHVF
jgi:hypothetical protein